MATIYMRHNTVDVNKRFLETLEKLKLLSTHGKHYILLRDSNGKLRKATVVGGELRLI